MNYLDGAVIEGAPRVFYQSEASRKAKVDSGETPM